MVSNLTQPVNFSTLNFQPDSLGNQRKESTKSTGSIIICTQKKACDFILRNPDFTRSETLYALTICHSYHPDFDLFSKKQESFYPTNLELRTLYRCKNTQQASKADTLRISFLKRGLIEIVKLRGIKRGKVKFSKKFLLQFNLFEFEKKRQKILDQTYLRMITEEDFKERLQIEKIIISLKKKIKEYLPEKNGCVQGTKFAEKKPLKSGSSEVSS